MLSVRIYHQPAKFSLKRVIIIDTKKLRLPNSKIKTNSTHSSMLMALLTTSSFLEVLLSQDVAIWKSWSLSLTRVCRVHPQYRQQKCSFCTTTHQWTLRSSYRNFWFLKVTLCSTTALLPTLILTLGIFSVFQVKISPKGYLYAISDFQMSTTDCYIDVYCKDIFLKVICWLLYSL